MNPNYRLFFELEKEPFASDIEKEHILVTDSLNGVNERIHYAMHTGAVVLVDHNPDSSTDSVHPEQ